jgi:hypothetical protein
LNLFFIGQQISKLQKFQNISKFLKFSENNFSAEPTVLLVPITSRDIVEKLMKMIYLLN